MSSSGPRYPGSVVDDSSIGNTSWSNPSNANADDGNYATDVQNNNQSPSHYLKATNFGFSIPDDATINGIVVEVQRKCSQESRSQDNAARIVKGGSIGSTDKSNANTWASSDEIISYGGETDLWGETWSANDINATGFGFALSVATGGLIGRTNYIDFIRITVYYTESSGGTTYTASSTEALSVSSSVTKAMRFSVNAASGISAKDNQNKAGMTFSLSATNASVFADMLSSYINMAATLYDSNILAEIANGAAKKSAHAISTKLLASSVTGKGIWGKHINDELSLLDALSIASILSAENSENLTFLTPISPKRLFDVIGLGAIGIGDESLPTVMFPKTLLDNTGLTDASELSATFRSLIEDGISLLSVIDLVQTIAVTASNIIVAIELIKAKLQMSQHATDIMNIDDLISSIKNISVAIDDVLTQLAIVQLQTSLGVYIDDSILMTVISRVSKIHATLQDLLSQYDETQIVALFSLDISQNAVFSDVISGINAMFALSSDLLSLSESIDSKASFTSEMSDALIAGWIIAGSKKMFQLAETIINEKAIIGGHGILRTTINNAVDLSSTIATAAIFNATLEANIEITEELSTSLAGIFGVNAMDNLDIAGTTSGAWSWRFDVSDETSFNTLVTALATYIASTSTEIKINDSSANHIHITISQEDSFSTMAISEAIKKIIGVVSGEIQIDDFASPQMAGLISAIAFSKATFTSSDTAKIKFIIDFDDSLAFIDAASFISIIQALSQTGLSLTLNAENKFVLAGKIFSATQMDSLVIAIAGISGMVYANQKITDTVNKEFLLHLFIENEITQTDYVIALKNILALSDAGMRLQTFSDKKMRYILYARSTLEAGAIASIIAQYISNISDAIEITDISIRLEQYGLVSLTFSSRKAIIEFVIIAPRLIFASQKPNIDIGHTKYPDINTISSFPTLTFNGVNLS